DVPIRKQSYLMKQTADFLELGYSDPQLHSLINMLDLPCLKAKDLRQELTILQGYIDDLGAPYVFCHNDFLGSNIMIVGAEKRILVIDLEYCAYGERGSDLAMLL